jgi:histidinol dehydrogenase
MPVQLSTTAPGFEAAFAALLSAKREDAPDVDEAVAAIIADVRSRGDAAVLELTARFDRLTLTPATLAFTAAEIDAAAAAVPADERAALELAAERITAGRCPPTRAGPMPVARRWAGAGPRWRRSGSMCPAGSPRIRLRC